MKKELQPTRRFGGTMTVPGDKSIAHRAALLSILAKDKISIKNFPRNADCEASLKAAQAFGVAVEESDGVMVLTPPTAGIAIAENTIIDCANSGTTARLLAGIVAGMPVRVILSGDESLSRRPMKRIIEPLTAMGAELFAEGDHLPLTVSGRKLLPFDYHLPIASAQVKSAILLAGLASSCSVSVREDIVTRSHTEVMLQSLGTGVTVRDIKPVPVVDEIDPRKKKMVMPEPFKREVSLTAQAQVTGGLIDIPGDFSTAAFFMGAAAISKKTLFIQNVGLNPTRTEFLDHLRYVGCTVEISDRSVISGEPRGTVMITGGNLKARKIHGETTVGLIDEIPMVAVMAAFADGTTVIRDAGELRVKESDRIQAIADNLKLMGVKCGVLEDGLAIEGGRELNGADFKACGDHRIAMAFSIAALFAVGPSTIDDASAVNVSCPEFYDLLDKITG